MAEQTLTAILEAKESITEALENVEDALEETATAARNASQGMKGASESSEELAQTATESATAVSREAEKLDDLSVSATSAEVSKDGVARANEELTTAAQVASKAMDSESRALTEMAFAAEEADDFINAVGDSGLVASYKLEQFEEELDDVAFAEVKATAAAGTLYPALQRIQQALDEVEDEADEAATGLDRFGMSALSTSLNLGPFNFALRNLLVMMPLLIMTTGSLTTAFLGLATAATAAAVGVGAIFGGGALAMAQGLAASSEDIEGTMQGLQKVMEKVSKMFQKAFAPLMNSGSIDMFVSLMEGVAVTINYVAQSMASMQGLLSNFAGNLGATWFQYFDDFVREIEKTVVAFLPVLEALWTWVGKTLPKAIAFFRDKSLEFLPTLSKLAHQVMAFAGAFTELGVTVMEGVLPVLTGILWFLTKLANLLNSLPDGVIKFAAAFTVASLALSKFWGIGQTLYLMLGDLYTAIFKTTGALETLKGVAYGIGGPFNVWGKAIEELQENLQTLQIRWAFFKGQSSLLPDGGLMGGQFSLPFDTWEKRLYSFGDAWQRNINDRIYNAYTSIGLFSETIDSIDPEGAVMRDTVFAGPRLGDRSAPEVNQLVGLDAAWMRLKRFKVQSVDFIKSVPGRLADGFRTIGNSAKRLGSRLLSVSGTLGDRFLNAIGSVQIAAYNLASSGINQLTSSLTGMSLTMDPILSKMARLSTLANGMVPSTILGGLSHSLNEWSRGEKSFTKGITHGLTNITAGKVLDGRLEAKGLRDMKTGRFTPTDGFITGRVMSSLDAFKAKLGEVRNSISATAKRYATLAAVKYQNIRTTILESTVTQKLGNLYSWVANSALVQNIKRYASLIKAKTMAYYQTIKETAANYGLFGSLGVVTGALTTGIGAIYSWITGLVSAESVTWSLSLSSFSAAGGISAMGIASTLATAPVTLLTGAVTALAGALALIGWTEVVVAIGAIMAVAGMAAGALGLMGKESGELAGVMSFFDGILSGLMETLITVGIPAWNMFVELIETVLSPFIMLNQILTAIGQTFGLIGKNSGFLSSFLRLLAQFLGGVAKIIGWILNKVQQIIDLIPGVDTANSLSALKVNEESVRQGQKQAKEKGSGMLGKGTAQGAKSAQKDKKNPESSMAKQPSQDTYVTNEYNYRFGDFNMKPENKAEVKRLVQEALNEANRNRRIRDGGV